MHVEYLSQSTHIQYVSCCDAYCLCTGLQDRQLDKWY